ncbi:MAG: metallophosphoesterase family protein, partial [Acidilobaceae archaeon]
MWQLDFLENVVRNSGGKHVIIAFHHSFFNTAGSYKGSIDDFRRYVHSAWRQSDEAESVARRLLDIVNKYDNIVAVLSGHIHRDADSIYERADGSKVYFITTVTSNHGYPEGYYWGMKLVEVCGDGGVKVLPEDRRYTPTSGSINTEAFKVFEVTDAHNTAVSWVFNTTGFTEFDMGNMTLVFYLNKTAPLESYKLYGDSGRVHRILSYDLGLYYLVKAYVNLKGSGSITMASYEDKTPPRIRIISMSPREPVLGRPLVFIIEASDIGWGIKTVEAIVNLDGKPIARVEAQRMMEPTQFRLIYNVRDPGKYDILLRAVDFNGNAGETRVEFSIGAPQTETPTPTETPTQTTTPVETPTETPTTITTNGPTTKASLPPTAEKTEFPVQVALLAIIAVIVLVVVLVFKLKRKS